MECLRTATITVYASHWEVRIGLNYDIVRSGDSLAFTAESVSGSRELTVRVERGRVADVAVWDATRAKRVSLPFESTVLGDKNLVCVVPLPLLREERMRARVLLNGALAGLSTVSWQSADRAAAANSTGADSLELASA